MSASLCDHQKSHPVTASPRPVAVVCMWKRRGEGRRRGGGGWKEELLFVVYIWEEHGRGGHGGGGGRVGAGMTVTNVCPYYAVMKLECIAVINDI